MKKSKPAVARINIVISGRTVDVEEVVVRLKEITHENEVDVESCHIEPYEMQQVYDSKEVGEWSDGE